MSRSVSVPKLVRNGDHEWQPDATQLDLADLHVHHPILDAASPA